MNEGPRPLLKRLELKNQIPLEMHFGYLRDVSSNVTGTETEPQLCSQTEPRMKSGTQLCVHVGVCARGRVCRVGWG